MIRIKIFIEQFLTNQIAGNTIDFTINVRNRKKELCASHITYYSPMLQMATCVAKLQHYHMLGAREKDSI